MASFTLTSDHFPNGTSVSVYALTSSPKRLNGAPPGSVVDSGTVSGGSVTFSSLTADTRYIAYASSPDRYTNFSTFTTVPPAQQVSGGGGSVVVTSANDATITATSYPAGTVVFQTNGSGVVTGIWAVAS